MTGWRKWVYRLIAAILAPTLFLLLVNLCLWLCDYGYPTDFFVKTRSGGSFTANQKFGWRFFPRAISRTPSIFELPARKADSSYRIFVLGGSAAMGEPDPAFGFSRTLEAMLREAFPGVEIQVVNAAMTAINSHVVLPIARDCARRSPDLFVIYMGNNEVVGPYGGGTIFAGHSANLVMIRSNIWLKSTKIGQLIASVTARSDSHSDWKGMEMFLGRQVAAADRRMKSVYRHFRTNLNDIIDVARGADADVLLCTVATNLKDCAPFAAKHRAGISAAELARWESRYAAGIAEANEARYANAVEQFLAAADIDGRRADLHFRLGRCYLQLNQFDAAREAFARARDLDTLRFRADTRINEIIRELADHHAGDRVWLVDAQTAFQESDRTLHKMPGLELFYEHVHMNPEGNYVLAKAVFRKIAVHLAARIDRHAGDDIVAPSKRRSEELIALTAWNRYKLAESISEMQDRPPFTNQLDDDQRRALRVSQLATLQRQGTSLEAMSEALARYSDAVKRNPDDLSFRLNLAELLRLRGEYDAAVRHYEAALRITPDFARPYNNCGNALSALGRHAEAVTHYQEALRIDPDYALAHNNCGNALSALGRHEQAVTHYEAAIRIKPNFALAHNNCGNALSALGRHAEAVTHYQEAVRVDPDFAGAHYKLGGVLLILGLPEKAVAHYKEFLRIEPDNAIAHYDCGNALDDHGRLKEAIGHYEQALKVKPDFVSAHNNLAWLLATSPDETIRDGRKALIHAKRAAQLVGHSKAAILDSLSAAYAELGEFDQAVQWQETAVELSASQLKDELRKRLEMYRRRLPYRAPVGH